MGVQNGTKRNPFLHVSRRFGPKSAKSVQNRLTQFTTTTPEGRFWPENGESPNKKPQIRGIREMPFS